MILESVCSIQAGFAAFVNIRQDSVTNELLVTTVLTLLAESLQQWGTLLMALYALAIQDCDSVFSVIVSRGLHETLLIGSTWILAGVEIGVIFATHSVSDGLIRSSQAMLITGFFDIVAIVIQAVLLGAYILHTKRSAQLVQTERQNVQAILLQERNRTAVTLCILNALYVVLNAPAVGIRLYFGSIDNSMSQDVKKALGITILSLWYVHNLLMLPIFLVRHKVLREEVTKMICRKCFKYEHDQFQHKMGDHFDRVQTCHEILRNPEKVAEVMTDSHRKKTIAGMPALMMTMSMTEGIRETSRGSEMSGTKKSDSLHNLSVIKSLPTLEESDVDLPKETSTALRKDKA